uniref:Uncharacterized protein n=1 Tax=Globodera rostochiensis TaxID=31243 RepID=A0A914GRF3_GLORO
MVDDAESKILHDSSCRCPTIRPLRLFPSSEQRQGSLGSAYELLVRELELQSREHELEDGNEWSFDRRPPDRAPSVVTLASRSSGGAGDNNNSNVSGTTSDGLSSIGRRIQQHPYPGDGAKCLLEMVQQPFFVRFG